MTDDALPTRNDPLEVLSRGLLQMAESMERLTKENSDLREREQELLEMIANFEKI